jgi:hypothetical protein
MTGTVVVYAEPPMLRRAGTFGVAVDGVEVGKVKQGSAARFPVAAGTHTVRVLAKDRSRSNAVTVQVVEDRAFVVTARSTGLQIAVLLPLLAGIAVPRVYVMAGVLLIGALFYAVPGLVFRVRADGDPERRTVQPAEAAPAETGLWWESDPALAKRYRKRADA